MGKNFNVYLDPACKGVISGKPSTRFYNQVLPEMIQIGMGVMSKQRFTTSKYISWKPP
jgi:hypothetical protein